jgi:hypothetical protein
VSWAGSFDSLQDPNKPELERSLSSFDIPYVIQFSYSYDLPVGHGRAFLGNMPRWADLINGVRSCVPSVGFAGSVTRVA